MEPLGAFNRFELALYAVHRRYRSFDLYADTEDEIAQLIEGLDLLEEVDPARYRMAARFVPRVLASSLTTFSDRGMRSVHIELEGSDPYFVACALVYSSAKLWLREKGIRDRRGAGRQTRLRIAYYQQTRFVRRYLQRTGLEPSEQRKYLDDHVAYVDEALLLRGALVDGRLIGLVDGHHRA